MAALGALLLSGSLGIYPDGHFDSVTKVTTGNFEGLVKETVDAGKTCALPVHCSCATQVLLAELASPTPRS